MSGSDYGSPGNEGPEHVRAHREHRDQLPYWKRAHHDWRFWVGMAITFAAIGMYVMSDNLAFMPRL